MKRTKQHRKPDAILCSDFHLREDTPVCRTDDYQMVQWKKVEFIRHLQMKYDCGVYHAGDLFHHWKPSPNLLSKAILLLPQKFHTIYGQHDLPQHNFELRHKSGIHTLQVDGTLEVLDECHWGQEPEEYSMRFAAGTPYTRDMLVWHKMTYQGKKLWPGQTDPTASKLLKKYPQFDLIVTGDNHKPFVEEYEGRLLVNPGSLMRMTADQKDYKPRVYLWNKESNTVKIEYIPIDPKAVETVYLEKTKERDERMESFIDRLQSSKEVGLSYEKNLENYLANNRVRSSVKDVINECIGG